MLSSQSGPQCRSWTHNQAARQWGRSTRLASALLDDTKTSQGVLGTQHRYGIARNVPLTPPELLTKSDHAAGDATSA